MGRPTRHSEEMEEKARWYLDHYQQLDDMIPSIAGLADYLGVGRRSLYDWAEAHSSFSHILETIKARQEKVLLNRGLSGEFNSAITKLALGKHGYTERQDLHHTGDLKTQLIVDKELDE